jgi:N-methylhydantoinase A/oxoprolinase/acetone carboxylase beta subunit
VDIRGSFVAGREAGRDAAHGAKTPRQAHIPEAGGFVEVPVYDRYRLPEGSTITGPAIVEEAEATTLLWPGDRLAVDSQRNLVIHVDVANPVTASTSKGASR